jgi:tripeptide aminopeptidase
MINKERLISEFLNLVKIDSESKNEFAISNYIKDKLTELKIKVIFDNSNKVLNSSVGNLIAKVNGTMHDSKTLMICAHMDTVVPGKNVKPIVKDNTITSSGDTILGADDKSSIAAILEALRCLVNAREKFCDLEVVLTICEEIGLLGAKNLDYSLLKSRQCIVLDSSDFDKIILQAPVSDKLKIKIIGKEAHAGVNPENGINAIKVASHAISKMRLGRIDSETTANVGIITGGRAQNVVPNEVNILAEARSRNETKLKNQVDHMIECFEKTAAEYNVTIDGKTYQAKADIEVNREYPLMNVSKDAHIVNVIKKAGNNLGFKLDYKESGGGSDANIFNSRGIESVVLGSGMKNTHGLNESLDIDSMAKSAELLLESIKEFSK